MASFGLDWRQNEGQCSLKIALRFPVWRQSFDFVVAYLENEMNFLTSMSWEEISRFEKVDGDINIIKKIWVDLYLVHINSLEIPFKFQGINDINIIQNLSKKEKRGSFSQLIL